MLKLEVIVPEEILVGLMFVRLLPLPTKDDAVIMPDALRFPSLLIERPIELFGFAPT